MSGIIVRPATEADLPTLALLMTELGYPSSLPEMAERFRNIRQQAGYETLVAEGGGEVLGAAGILRVQYWERTGHYIRVQVLVVRSTARRLGVGRILLRAVEDLGLETGATLISLNCGHKDARIAAHQFYPQMGFEHTSAGYTKWLRDQAPGW